MGPRRGVRGSRSESGFTLLEVMLAMAILAVSLVSLLGSQMASIRASRYARDLTAATYLADYQLVEIQYDQIRQGWQQSDVTYEGDFAELERPEMNYECLVDFIELPEWNEIIEAKTDADQATDGDDGMYADSGDAMFGAMGAVWPLVKAAIENSIRKAHCKVTWSDGRYDHESTVTTFWTDPEALTQLPGLGGEFTDADDDSGDGPSPDAGGGGGGGGGGRGGASGPGGLRGPGGGG